MKDIGPAEPTRKQVDEGRIGEVLDCRLGRPLVRIIEARGTSTLAS